MSFGNFGVGPISNSETFLFNGKAYSLYRENEVDLSKYFYFSRDDLDNNFAFDLHKGKCTVKAAKVTSKYHKSKYFKITLINKISKKPQKNLKLKVKVFTGKNYKTIIVKTNKKGVAKFNTKTFARGNHKVIITSKNSMFSINKKSSFKIR